MSAVVAAPRARWINAAWFALVAGWLCLLVPGPRIAQVIGLVLVIVAVMLSVMAIVRRGPRAGIVPLLAALVVTPLVYFGAGMLHVRRDDATPAASAPLATTAATGDAATSVRPAPVVTAPPAPQPDIAMRTTVTAVELAGAYQGGTAADADRQYKGQRLLLAGMIDSLDPDAAGGPVVTFNAGDMAPVRALGLPRDVAASLRPGQQVILACNGAGAMGGKATVDGCRLTR